MEQEKVPLRAESVPGGSRRVLEDTPRGQPHSGERLERDATLKDGMTGLPECAKKRTLLLAPHKIPFYVIPPTVFFFLSFLFPTSCRLLISSAGIHFPKIHVQQRCDYSYLSIN